MIENGKFKNQYRIPSARLQSWDYGWNGAYFVTIGTENRVHFFGEIVDSEMGLNKNGILAEKYWYKIPVHFPFVKIGAFVVMPNHVHGIIVIDQLNGDNGNHNPKRYRRDAINRVSTTMDGGGITGNKNPMLHDNLSRFIRWYKGRVTFESRKMDTGFAWQPRFYDHIIRNEKSFNQITEYINTNPKKWPDDQFYGGH